MIKIFFQREGRYVEVAPGETLLNAARKAGVEVHRHEEAGHRCFATEHCTTCAVQVNGGGSALSPRTAMERDIPNGLRLACQARAFSDTVINTLDEARFIADTAAPTWALFSGSGAALPATSLHRMARA